MNICMSGVLSSIKSFPLHCRSSPEVSWLTLKRGALPRVSAEPLTISCIDGKLVSTSPAIQPHTNSVFKHTGVMVCPHLVSPQLDGYKKPARSPTGCCSDERSQLHGIRTVIKTLTIHCNISVLCMVYTLLFAALSHTQVYEST